MNPSSGVHCDIVAPALSSERLRPRAGFDRVTCVR